MRSSNLHQRMSSESKGTRRTMKRLAAALFIVSSCASTANGFAMLPAAATDPAKRTAGRAFHRPLQPQQQAWKDLRPSSSVSSVSVSRSMLLDPLLLSSELSSASSEFLLSDSSLVQAEFLNGVTHFLLDFTTLFGAATIVIRLSAVIGRLVVMAQDFAPGHEILPDELAFQIGLLLVACHALMNTLLPKLKAHYLAPPLMTSQDRLAFRLLFRPAGISWHQYKELHMSSMDWVTVEPGHVILSEEDNNNSGATTSTAVDGNEDAVYWLYKGDAHILNNGTLLHKIPGDRQKDVAGLGLLGETRLAQLFSSNKHDNNKDTGSSSSNSSDNKKKSSSSNSSKSSSSTSRKKKITAVAGETGAMLLRMNTTKLEKLLKHDQELTNSVSRLAFKGMQDKLDALLVLNASAN